VLAVARLEISKMSSLKIEYRRIPAGSTILVTGGSRFIGGHIVNQLMQLGYKVCSTGRDADRSVWTNKFFEQPHGPRKLEFVEVKDFSMAENFWNAMKGVEGLIYVASRIDI